VDLYTSCSTAVGSIDVNDKVPYTLEEDLAITNALRNVNYLDEDTLHLRSLDQEPLQSSVEVEETETEPANEKKIHNPLLAIQVLAFPPSSFLGDVVVVVSHQFTTANAGSAGQRIGLLRGQRDVGSRRRQDR